MPSSITLTVKHLPTSTSFFLSALQPLGYVYRGRVENTIGFGLQDSPPDFWISQETPGVPAGAAHVAFPAASQKNVQEFFVLGLKSGGKCHGEPALRDPKFGYYSAAVIDFDGNSIEAVFRPELVDEGYGSRPSSISSVSSAKSKSISKSPTVVSKASTAKPTHTEVRSVAPSQASKASSRTPTSVSKAPTTTSKSPSQVSRAPTSAPTQVSRAPSQTTRVLTQSSRAPVSTTPSLSEGVVPLQLGQASTYVTPSGEVVTSFITEAYGALNIAKELASHVRPAFNSVNSAPTVQSKAAPPLAADPNGHKPSDTIVGTLLGVAAGAALGYAYHKVTEGDKRRESELQGAGVSRPNISRTNTEPSFANGEQRMYYYHEYTNKPANQPYAIEAPPSEYTSASGYRPSRVGSQRYITMEDKDERMSDYTPSQRPRRRSSFSGTEVRSFATQSRASQAQALHSSGTRMLEGPPTSYRAPTALTQIEAESRVSGSSRSRSKSRVSSTSRTRSASGTSKASRRGHDNDDSRSNVSRRSSAEKSDATTVKPIKPSAVSSASTSKAPSRAPSHTGTVVRPEDVSLPPSRAGTTISATAPSDYHSTHSKSNKTAVGRMLERERSSSGRTELTKSVVGKIEESEKLNVSSREVDPSDSVSQVSSVRSKKSTRRHIKEWEERK